MKRLSGCTPLLTVIHWSQTVPKVPIAGKKMTNQSLCQWWLAKQAEIWELNDITSVCENWHIQKDHMSLKYTDGNKHNDITQWKIITAQYLLEHNTIIKNMPFNEEEGIKSSTIKEKEKHWWENILQILKAFIRKNHKKSKKLKIKDTKSLNRSLALKAFEDRPVIVYKRQAWNFYCRWFCIEIKQII